MISEHRAPVAACPILISPAVGGGDYWSNLPPELQALIKSGDPLASER
jgi:hypothetical protein